MSSMLMARIARLFIVVPGFLLEFLPTIYLPHHSPLIKKQHGCFDSGFPNLIFMLYQFQGSGILVNQFSTIKVYEDKLIPIRPMGLVKCYLVCLVYFWLVDPLRSTSSWFFVFLLFLGLSLLLVLSFFCNFLALDIMSNIFFCDLWAGLLLTMKSTNFPPFPGLADF